MATQQNKSLWWQQGIIYQIYPRSFQDSNGDGTGDLRGILSRLDHLKELGIDAIWVSPIYPSPMADFGYDIADYRGIHELFGTMDDFDELLRETHKRGMKLLLDLVPNHTSDQHPWFLESRSSRDNPKRDWYLWYDGKEGGEPPNNWVSVFGGSSWEWDEATQQFYYHAFLKSQPDLNWRNSEVEQAVFEAMRFWLDKGVDGFRVDAMWLMIKDKQLRDNPPNPDFKPGMNEDQRQLPIYSSDRPEVHKVVKKMREVLDQYPERMMIGEIYLAVDKAVKYHGKDNQGVHLAFNNQLFFLPWEAKPLAEAIDKYEKLLKPGDWPNWVLGNHDQSRIGSRVGLEQARVAAMLLLTLRGTPTIYYGEEIGMRDVPIPKEEFQDPQGINLGKSRDPGRTPMQWDDSDKAGFTTGKPWLRIAEDFPRVNVKKQQEEPSSMLALHQRLIRLRRQEPALHEGDYKTIQADEQVFAFLRKAKGHPSFLIVLNMGHKTAVFKPETIKLKGTVAVATIPERDGIQVDGVLNLAGDEGLLIRLD
ncbi:alpha-amylase family glycosyl hydrolase [Nibrella saemangeumensis]|uniref:Alpha-amylase family glycosyl hydrolase n=1 Tax=Nibrella saemangeumensis TaxID=1084526 RepID=A0ABP8MNU7_9BACT